MKIALATYMWTVEYETQNLHTRPIAMEKMPTRKNVLFSQPIFPSK